MRARARTVPSRVVCLGSSVASGALGLRLGSLFSAVRLCGVGCAFAGLLFVFVCVVCCCLLPLLLAVVGLAWGGFSALLGSAFPSGCVVGCWVCGVRGSVGHRPIPRLIFSSSLGSS